MRIFGFMIGAVFWASLGFFVLTTSILIFGGTYIAETRVFEDEALADKLIGQMNDKYYKVACFDYKNAGFWGRNWTYRDYRWCEEYLDKM